MEQKKKKTKRASYREGVAWIALNDDPAGDQDEAAISSMISVALLADLFGKDVLEVARAVLRFREQHDADERLS